jgi:hypothetical protein
LRAEHPEIPTELERICFRALSKKPEERYATCREMAKDLVRWLAGRAISLEAPAMPSQTAAAGLDAFEVVAATGSAEPGSSSRAPINLARTDPSLPPNRGWDATFRRTLLHRPIAAAALLVSLLGFFGYSAASRWRSNTVMISEAPRTRLADANTVASSTETKLVPAVQTDAPEFIATRLGAIKRKRILAGTFLMGSPDDDRDAGDDEKPQV